MIACGLTSCGVRRNLLAIGHWQVEHSPHERYSNLHILVHPLPEIQDCLRIVLEQLHGVQNTRCEHHGYHLMHQIETEMKQYSLEVEVHLIFIEGVHRHNTGALVHSYLKKSPPACKLNQHIKNIDFKSLSSK